MKLSRTNGRGLATTAPYQGLGAGSGSNPCTYARLKICGGRPRRPWARSSLPKHVQTQKILVTLAERPHPFPSRTRQLSSPAPKILRGQPFGKIGRRQGFCVNAPNRRRRPHGRSKWHAVKQIRPRDTGLSSVDKRRRRPVDLRPPDAPRAFFYPTRDSPESARDRVFWPSAGLTYVSFGDQRWQ